MHGLKTILQAGGIGGGTACCSLLSCYGSKDWTVEERFFPVSSLLFSVLMTVLSLS